VVDRVHLSGAKKGGAISFTPYAKRTVNFNVVRSPPIRNIQFTLNHDPGVVASTGQENITCRNSLGPPAIYDATHSRRLSTIYKKTPTTH
jgi:hypothetical protein